MVNVPFYRESFLRAGPNIKGEGALTPEIQRLQEKNLGNLLEIFSAATPVLEEIAKVKPETWRQMTGLFTALEKTFGTTVQKIGQGFLTPRKLIVNRFKNTMMGHLGPLMVQLNNIQNQVEAFALQNPQGAAIGSTIGILGYYWGPTVGAITMIAGGLLGAVLESVFKLLPLTPQQMLGGWTWLPQFPSRQEIIDALSGDNRPGATQTAAGEGIFPGDPRIGDPLPVMLEDFYPERERGYRKYIRDFE